MFSPAGLHSTADMLPGQVHLKTPASVRCVTQQCQSTVVTHVVHTACFTNVVTHIGRRLPNPKPHILKLASGGCNVALLVIHSSAMHIKPASCQSQKCYLNKSSRHLMHAQREWSSSSLHVCGPAGMLEHSRMCAILPLRVHYKVALHL